MPKISITKERDGFHPYHVTIQSDGTAIHRPFPSPARKSNAGESRESTPSREGTPFPEPAHNFPPLGCNNLGTGLPYNPIPFDLNAFGDGGEAEVPVLEDGGVHTDWSFLLDPATGTLPGCALVPELEESELPSFSDRYKLGMRAGWSPSEIDQIWEEAFNVPPTDNESEWAVDTWNQSVMNAVMVDPQHVDYAGWTEPDMDEIQELAEIGELATVDELMDAMQKLTE
jgi:hypothetical protein